MQCPICKLDQVIVEYREVELDLCIDGCGLWFDADELRQLFEVAGVPDKLHDLEQSLELLPRGEHGAEKRCPRCRGKMRHVRAPGPVEHVILDRCRRGHGLWFDRGELEEILGTLLGEGEDALETVKEFLGQFVPESRVDPESAATPPSDANAEA